MRQNDQLFWIWLSEALGAGNPDFRILIDLYEAPYDIFLAEPAELERIGRLSERSLQALSDKNLARAASILELCERLGIGVMPYSSELYPGLLRELRNPPVLLYYAGTVPALDSRLCIGMVGTRKMSAYGMETAYKISYELASANAVIVSGMAAGIDGVCAAAALRANGTTVAVLGCGLDRVYPPHHGLLMNEIAKHGLLLSEYPPGTKPVYYHFPVRNRIISGLSHGIVVVEAGMGSGSLITAKEAVMQGRDVFAVPANADGAGAEGTNGLLRDGAIFTVGSSDVLDRYQYLFASSLHPERIRAGAGYSTVDRAYLRQLGVIGQSTSERSRVSAGSNERQPVSASEPASVVPAGHTVHTDSGVDLVANRTAAAASAPHKRASEPSRSDRPTRTARTEKGPAPDVLSGRSAGAATPDAVLQSLSPIQLAILQAIPDDRSVSVDALNGLGYPCGEIITALTMLELSGLIQKLPGALYSKI